MKKNYKLYNIQEITENSELKDIKLGPVIGLKQDKYYIEICKEKMIIPYMNIDKIIFKVHIYFDKDKINFFEVQTGENLWYEEDDFDQTFTLLNMKNDFHKVCENLIDNINY